MKPTAAEHPEYYGRYIGLVKQDQVSEAISSTAREVINFIRSLNENIGDYAYAEGKWTVKEVFIHCMDTERIFSTRALGFARGEQQQALSYDENIYAAHSKAQARSLKGIAEEFESVAGATLKLFDSFSAETLQAVGHTPSGPATVNAIGFAICGHTLHHMNVLRERYLK